MIRDGSTERRWFFTVIYEADRWQADGFRFTGWPGRMYEMTRRSLFNDDEINRP